MENYLTVAQVAEQFGVSEKRAANLMSENGIRALRVYPADQVKQIQRPGQGHRSDLSR